MAKTLAQFSIKRTGEDYRITLEDEDGGTATWNADEDQLDQIVEAIENRDEDEEEAAESDEDEEDED
ncbi:hypothetical protein WG901_02895 [Novosphingobium sp. PS1R-30]|uniref:Uncharacterized protein n=1 Tax=Novosphingobium anseongense TaxID=3133436 RepID=A0ABU8RR51_9SPHN|nr:MAG: hypothetical protein EOO76_03155 [Novosphingobium sp.]